MGFGRRDIDRQMKMEIGIIPIDTVAATIVGAGGGAGINRRGTTGADSGASAVLHVACGAAGGSPSTQTVDATLQDSADNSTDWQDIGSPITQLTGDDEDGSTPNVNLVGVRKFVRAEVVVAFTGGSTPTIPVAATICFGGRE